MADLQIYGVAYSRSLNTIWAALELGLDFERVPIGWHDSSLYGDEFRRINPNARVPAIKDGDFVLWESAAINLYLARKAGGPLAPRDVREEGLAMQWSFWAMLHLERPLGQWAVHTFMNDPPDGKPDLAAKGWDEAQPQLKVMEGQLAKGPYLLGQRLTIADLNVACTMFRRQRPDFSAFPKIKAWDAAVFDLPAAKRAWTIRMQDAEQY
ncbi:MAG: glutathione S-transferase family protein [Alphaproteobacteria bacterium]|nr:glutathione S-transferase family protein [Alphaproteobacteria bacterium]